VASRRLGRSLGVDIVPHKACTLNCIYCQVGRTSKLTIRRKEYVSIKAVLDELKQRLAEGLQADYITISGSGEPTLNSCLGELIDGIRQITKIPIAIITNGTLLYRQDVRADCAKADVVLPSLDAGTEDVFRKINRPHKNISIEKLISGLCRFRKEYSGQIWLEVFLVEGVNTDSAQVTAIKEAIEKIQPDKVQLNTAVRPTAEKGVGRLDEQRLREIAAQLGNKAEVIADFAQVVGGKDVRTQAEDVLAMLKRRPGTVEDISAGLGISGEEALEFIQVLQRQGVISCEEKGGVRFFKAKEDL
jgi:wyosine [tRNA(Phe)-imidazoG37] synthetase (radical SAM superfamily)